MENRVRKLKMEDDRLQKQILIAQKHSALADQFRERKEQDDREKQHARELERQRIEMQHSKNEYERTKNLTGIATN